MFKDITKSQLRNAGKKITPINPYPEKLEPIKHQWLKDMAIGCVIDVGASDGGFAKKAREMFPSCEIFSFEAIPDSFHKLKANFSADNRFQAFNIALSNSTGEVKFYESSNTGSNSLLVMDELHKTVYPSSK
jgi:23S rRNA U2552 (ribose-2'-O)-methylase RlmE/FtsJ